MCSSAGRRCLTGGRGTFNESDIVLLRPTTNTYADPILTKPLAAATTIHTHKGNISHADIIGKRVRDTVRASTGSTYRIHDVTLAEYVRMTKRLVTPIYPTDAQLIANLFDLHVSPPAPEDEAGSAPLEILEAGTGHGALTLHLSRAIHAANPPKPAGLGSLGLTTDDEATSPASTYLLSQWKKERRAVIHTIDVHSRYSKHAEKVVKGFRRGLYSDNVDFHVGDVSEWVSAQLETRQGTADDAATSPFLSHAFLDLPATHTHLRTVASALHADGMLVIFSPSITQITDSFRKVKEDGIPLFLDQVLELGTNGSTGGREWDVRAVVPRATPPPRDSLEATASETEVSDTEKGPKDEEQRVATPRDSGQDWNVVCRPKVGERIVGGGFLGVFRKKREDPESLPS